MILMYFSHETVQNQNEKNIYINAIIEELNVELICNTDYKLK